VITCRAGKIDEVRTHADAQYATTYFCDETMGTEIKEGRRQGAATQPPSRRGKPRQRSRNSTNPASTASHRVVQRRSVSRSCPNADHSDCPLADMSPG
jgi:hypothetical protein